VIGLHPTGAWPVSRSQAELSQAEACKNRHDWLAVSPGPRGLERVIGLRLYEPVSMWLGEKKARRDIARARPARNEFSPRFHGAWPGGLICIRSTWL
jgi:hypothetical protein